MKLKKYAQFAEIIDTDIYQKIKSDPRWSAMREEHGIRDPDYSEVAFDLPLPEGNGC